MEPAVSFFYRNRADDEFVCMAGASCNKLSTSQLILSSTAVTTHQLTPVYVLSLYLSLHVTTTQYCKHDTLYCAYWAVSDSNLEGAKRKRERFTIGNHILVLFLHLSSNKKSPFCFTSGDTLSSKLYALDVPYSWEKSDFWSIQLSGSYTFRHSFLDSKNSKTTDALEDTNGFWNSNLLVLVHRYLQHSKLHSVRQEAHRNYESRFSLRSYVRIKHPFLPSLCKSHGNAETVPDLHLLFQYLSILYNI